LTWPAFRPHLLHRRERLPLPKRSGPAKSRDTRFIISDSPTGSLRAPGCPQIPARMNKVHDELFASTRPQPGVLLPKPSITGSPRFETYRSVSLFSTERTFHMSSTVKAELKIVGRSRLLGFGTAAALLRGGRRNAVPFGGVEGKPLTRAFGTASLHKIGCSNSHCTLRTFTGTIPAKSPPV